jgi:predicted RNase H-like nuclease
LINKYEQIEPLILIDIPIGLKNGGRGERLSDLGACRILKARKSSIFPVPCREAVYMESYKKACEVNEKLKGKRISKQAWNIVPKILDVDSFLVENKISQEKIKEVGPKVYFQVFKGFPMKYSKKSHDGFLERKETFKNIYLFTDKIIEAALSEYRRKEVAKDDILDALVAAITAKMGYIYGFEFVPREPETDINGLKIQMVYCIPNLIDSTN